MRISWCGPARSRPSASLASRPGAAAHRDPRGCLDQSGGGCGDAPEISRARPDPDKSGGDNLAATFSPELADLTLYVIDVAAGDKIPSKGGPGITRSDLLVINKIDLAPYVGASLEVMERDAARMRGARPFVMTNLRDGRGVAEIARFVEEKGGLAA